MFTAAVALFVIMLAAAVTLFVIVLTAAIALMFGLYFDGGTDDQRNDALKERSGNILTAVSVKLCLDLFVVPGAALIVGTADGFHVILFGGLDMLGLDDRAHNILTLEVRLCAMPVFVTKSIHGNACILEIAVQFKAIHLELLLKATNLHGDLFLDDILVDLDFCIVDSLLQRGILVLELCIGGCFRLKLSPDAGPEIFYGIEFRSILDKVIVQLRDLFKLDIMNGDLENDSLARKVLCLIILGEGDVQIALLTLLHADHLLFKAGNEGVGTDLELIALCSAALELFIAKESGEIDDGGVAFLKGTILNTDCAGCCLEPALDLTVNVFIRNSILNAGDFYTFVLTQLNLGVSYEFCGKYNAILLGSRDDDDFGLKLGDKVVFLECFGISMLNKGIDFIIPEYILAVGGFDALAGGLALAEAGNLITGSETAISAVESIYICISGNRKLKSDFSVFGTNRF